MDANIAELCNSKIVGSIYYAYATNNNTCN